MENQAKSSPLAVGAMIAALLAATWVLEYLVVTSYGNAFSGTRLLRYVLGQEYGAFADTETLTVCILRYLIGYSLLWPVTTAIVILFRKATAAVMSS